MRENAFKLIKFIIIIWCLCLILGCGLIASFSRSVAQCILDRHFVHINLTDRAFYDNFRTNYTNTTASNVTYSMRNETRSVRTTLELKSIKTTYTLLVIAGAMMSGIFHTLGLVAVIKESYCLTVGYAVFMTFNTVFAFILTFRTKYEWIYVLFSVFITMIVYSLASGIRERHMRIDSNLNGTDHFGPKPEVPVVNVYGANRPPTPHPTTHPQNSVTTFNNQAFNPTVNNNNSMVAADNVLSYYEIMPTPVVLPPLTRLPVPTPQLQ